MSGLSLGELYRKLNRLTLPDIQKVTSEVILADRQILIRKRAEMESGVNPEGQSTGAYRSRGYQLFKQKLNPLAGGRPDWILTGGAIKENKLVYLGNGKYVIDNPVYRQRGLFEAFPNFGLETINREVFRSLQQTKYAPEVNNRLRSQAGL